MTELSRREKEAGILPDPDVDAYMKAALASDDMCFLVVIN